MSNWQTSRRTHKPPRSPTHERANDQLGARAFVDACARGDVEGLLAAVEFLDADAVGGWRLAMMRVARLPAVDARICAAFVNIWKDSKSLPLRVANRRVFANALRLLMPANYEGSAVRLYRGAAWEERCHRQYGFSWTRDLKLARNRYAEYWRVASQGGGVVLETLAPREAILLVREGEVVVDPFKLGKIAVAERVRPADRRWGIP